MTWDETKKMHEINVKIILGDPISDEEKKFFNDHLDNMKEEAKASHFVWERAKKYKP